MESRVAGPSGQVGTVASRYQGPASDSVALVGPLPSRRSLRGLSQVVDRMDPVASAHDVVLDDVGSADVSATADLGAVADRLPIGRAERRRLEAQPGSSRRVAAPPTGPRPDRRRRSMLALKVGCLAAVAALGTVIIVQHDGGATVTTVTAAPTGSPTGSQWAGSGGPGTANTPAPAAAFLGVGTTPGAGALTGSPGSPAAAGAVPSGSARSSARGSGAGVAGARGSGAAAAGGRSAGAVPATKQRTNQAGGTLSVQMYGPTLSGLAWHSGFWLGGTKSTDRMNQAGAWRGRPMDFATAYPQYADWNQIADPSSCIGLFAGFKGRLALGLPLLPSNRAGQWDDILSGAHDDVFRTIARNMKASGFGDSVVRVGLEANGDWFPWAANASNAAQYKAAFRRVVGLMRAVAPQLSFWFDTSASANSLPGAPNRLDVFSLLYPGDDVVDGISMDHYDFYSVVARNASEFTAAMRPANGAGLADAADFARKHGKGFAVPEWGLHAQQGAGDNPYFFTGMYGFFQQNKDVLVFEDYFNENASYIGASIWDPVQNPQSSAVYKQLWGG